jgi:hypothetical protein
MRVFFIRNSSEVGQQGWRPAERGSGFAAAAFALTRLRNNSVTGWLAKLAHPGKVGRQAGYYTDSDKKILVSL